VVGAEGLGGGTTGNGVHHGRLNLSEVTSIQETADEFDDLSTSAEDIARAVVHDEVQVALAETLLLVLEAVVLGRNCVQARSQESNLSGEDGKFTIVTVLGVSAAGETHEAHNVTSAKQLVLLLERLAGRELCLAYNLDLNTLSADIVEDQLVSRGSLGVDTTSDANGKIGLLFALLETLMFLDELAEVGVDMELVRVGIRLLGLAQFVDSLASNLEVLLK
jgi:hypothetical protein